MLRASPLRRALASLTAQAVRYAVAGAVVALVYVGLTLLLSGPLGVVIQVAILVAYVLAVALHFALQRWFVFGDRRSFALAAHQQVGRYVVLGAAQYSLTALATTVLPELLGVGEQVVYLATVVAISATGFVLLRTRIFHAA